MNYYTILNFISEGEIGLATNKWLILNLGYL